FSLFARVTHDFKEEISLDCLCQQFGVSKFHLCREFKRYIGRSVTHYLIENRLNFAKELLRNSTLSISCISEQCGINHVSHFINLFKRKEGITPAVYRKEWR
ncbi:MAG: helix-turn-helix transcriptional regulator, partial [Hungatella sp.]